MPCDLHRAKTKGVCLLYCPVYGRGGMFRWINTVSKEEQEICCYLNDAEIVVKFLGYKEAGYQVDERARS